MNNKITVILYYSAALLFYIVAAIQFFDSGFSSGVVWVCLGSAFLCFGSAAQTRNKNKKFDDEDNSNEK